MRSPSADIWRPAAEKARAEGRDAKIADFVLSALITALGASGGSRLPADEDARELVRLARSAYDEIDHPTEPPSAVKGQEKTPEPVDPDLDSGDPWDSVVDLLGGGEGV